jgi:ABC-type transporter Mla subunit MlaD
MMSNEEFDRRMEFFLNRQAQFDADMQQMQEVDKRIGERLDRTNETLAELATLTREGFAASLENFAAIAEDSRNTDAKINALVDSQIRTEEKIKSVNDKLDRHLKEDHNGDSTPDNP